MLLDARKLNELLGMTCVYSEEHNNHHMFSMLDMSVQNGHLSQFHYIVLIFLSSQLVDFIGFTGHYYKPMAIKPSWFDMEFMI